jgi:8-oxo-dGTP diphosphatase
LADTIRAAGGVLWRPAASGPEVCLVHRPHHDDWSLPKGKLEPGEHPLVAAVREVREETGVHARPQSRLPRVAYDLPDGTPKTVDFWMMRAADGPVAGPDDPGEVDEVSWLPLPQAAQRVSYPDDARLLHHAATLPPVTAVLPLVRHGHAGRRGAFDGPDADRPLDDRGRHEAQELAVLLALSDPQRLVSATPLRCLRTLQPLAERLDLPIVADPAFDEPADGETVAERVAVAAARLTGLVGGDRTVVCSQGKLMPSLLASLAGTGDPKDYRTAKGSGWLLCFSGDRLVSLDRL